MFEKNTYDAIMTRTMERLPSNLQTDEGSFLYTAAGPVSIEHEQMYTAMDSAVSECFVTTASMDGLKLIGESEGLYPHEKSAAVWSAAVTPNDLEVRIGARFNCGTMNLVVTGEIETGLWELTCETAGTSGNRLRADLVPIAYVYGLKGITLVEVIKAGSDDESTEDFRKRLLTHFQKPAASGNAYSYVEWATSVNGVGAAKCFPLWQGPGTVKVVITDSERRAATPALVAEVAEYIEENRTIGATVTVTSGVEKDINVAATVRLKTGYSLSSVQQNFKDALTEYLDNNAYDTDRIPISKVGCILLNTTGIEDYVLSTLRINDARDDVILDVDEIAVMGVAALEVIP